MDKKLLDFIRSLSEADKKTLCQKALKTTEEVGELAKAVLPFENAAGTLHRFSDRNKILENVVDVFLSSISIAHEMKFTDEEIEEMVWKKTKKWQDIQTKENGIKFPLPYEIHVTIERPSNIEQFKAICKDIGVKPIIIDLEKDDKVVMQDVMTSSVHIGNNRSAYEEAMRIRDALQLWGWDEDGYKPIRTKIETVPWHPAAPSYNDANFKMPANSYFESHLRIVAREKDKQVLQMVATQNGAKLSRNFFKKLSDDKYIIMMTLRLDNIVREEFEKRVNDLKEELLALKFTVDKTEIEFALYDTKLTHDLAWIG